MDKQWFLSGLMLLVVASTAGHAQTADRQRCDPGRPVDTHTDMRVIRSCSEGTSYFTTTSATPSGQLTVLVHGLAQYRRAYETQATRDPNLDPAKLILYVDDRPLPRFHGRLPADTHSHLSFDLAELSRRTSGHPDSVSAWKLLLADGIRDRRMMLSVGFAGRGPLPSEVDDFQIDAISTQWLVVWFVQAIVLLVLLVWAGSASDMLRVPGEPPPVAAGGTTPPRRAFSLARVQMAAWFYAVLVAYVFLYLVTGALDTISATVLGLMGISAATGLAATIVDTGTMAPGEVAVTTQGFVQDLMREGAGLSLPRLQIAAWTVVLLFIFARAIYDTLAMPEFSGTLLGLMGISGGTYVGFKPPDKKS